eukprot:TRINITY_DN62801_c0_g1_i2.p1 TRINITY_DN62801_c0_g1~~TRINITY_DN62801_c0_g1_i2.p1  ORF type:complete len:324 (-),score=85.59 TRINITY_DN62801_c0_g1_i2:21-992(-)
MLRSLVGSEMCIRDRVVESQALAAVDLPPLSYAPALPRECIEQNRISEVQLELVVLAGQRHDRVTRDGFRDGFLIGDGTGMGKGRTIASIIWDNWLQGRKKAVWVSASNDLYHDAMRDLASIGAHELLAHVLQFPHQTGDELVADQGIVFTSYSALARGYHRATVLTNWLGFGFEGVVAFDEAHAAKHARSGAAQSRTGEVLLGIQRELKLARVVYASATAATDISHMGYLDRLSLWGSGTAFRTFEAFRESLDSRGLGAREAVAVSMKATGCFCARFISFQGTEFGVRMHKITEAQEEICLLYTSDAADEEDSVDLGGRRIS